MGINLARIQLSSPSFRKLNKEEANFNNAGTLCCTNFSKLGYGFDVIKILIKDFSI